MILNVLFDMIQHMSNEALLFDILIKIGGFSLTLKHWSLIN